MRLTLKDGSRFWPISKLDVTSFDDQFRTSHLNNGVWLGGEWKQFVPCIVDMHACPLPLSVAPSSLSHARLCGVTSLVDLRFFFFAIAAVAFFEGAKCWRWAMPPPTTRRGERFADGISGNHRIMQHPLRPSALRRCHHRLCRETPPRCL